MLTLTMIQRGTQQHVDTIMRRLISKERGAKHKPRIINISKNYILFLTVIISNIYAQHYNFYSYTEQGVAQKTVQKRP